MHILAISGSLKSTSTNSALLRAAAQTLAPAGHWILTAELKTSLLRPARCERLVCEAHVLKPGRQITFTEAHVWAVSGDERTLVMKASATMAVTAPKA